MKKNVLEKICSVFRICTYLIVALLIISCQSNNSAMLEIEDKPAIEDEPRIPYEDEERIDVPFVIRKDILLTDVERQLSEQVNTFAFNLIKAVYADEKEKDKNIQLSPMSATLALSLLNNGAAGTTGEEIRKTLGFDNVSNEEWNFYTQKIINAMQTLDPRGTFEVANGMWIQNDFPVLNTFKQVNQQYYNAEIQNVDFKQPIALQTINNWVSEKTHGTIPEMLKYIDPLTRLILGNTIYFKGYWKDRFNKENTSDAVFKTSSGENQKVPTMRKTFINRYIKLAQCAVLELPFGNEAFSMVFVLPDENSDVSAVISTMDSGWWAQIVNPSSSRYYEVKQEIPKFKLEYERSLVKDLKALGMNLPFDKDAADFSLISNQESLFVSDVKQKTFVQMDEEAMTAAAATLIFLDVSAGVEYTYPRVDFKVNRPFLYFIKEESTGLIFFTGIIHKIN